MNKQKKNSGYSLIYGVVDECGRLVKSIMKRDKDNKKEKKYNLYRRGGKKKLLKKKKKKKKIFPPPPPSPRTPKKKKKKAPPKKIPQGGDQDLIDLLGWQLGPVVFVWTFGISFPI